MYVCICTSSHTVNFTVLRHLLGNFIFTLTYIHFIIFYYIFYRYVANLESNIATMNCRDSICCLEILSSNNSNNKLINYFCHKRRRSLTIYNCHKLYPRPWCARITVSHHNNRFGYDN